jgi:hypothetical protein
VPPPIGTSRATALSASSGRRRRKRLTAVPGRIAEPRIHSSDAVGTTGIALACQVAAVALAFLRIDKLVDQGPMRSLVGRYLEPSLYFIRRDKVKK